MGRKSRRNRSEELQVVQTGQEIFLTAIYARLSVENCGKVDDTAFVNQIEICKEYVKECPDLQLVKVYEDNGWTGTVMRRPAFDELMEDVRKGLITAVVVRDLSRFGRNYIETGTYLEKIFPRLGVRFISVKERFDTSKVDKSNESLMVPLQNLINDLYAKDISRKVETAFHVQMKEGNFKWSNLPYGYRWDKEHKNIIPDEVTAPVVRNIFQWVADGMSRNKVAEKLDKLGSTKYRSESGKEQRLWSTSTIGHILSNPAYIGNRVYGRTHSALYKGIKLEKVSEEEWHVIENAHEPLVTIEIYNKVQEQILQNAKKRQDSMKKNAKAREKLVNLFENKIFCADCGYEMYFHRHQIGGKNKHWFAEYYCSSTATRKHLGCSYHYIAQDSLHEKVLSALRMQIEVVLDYETVIQKYKDSRADKDIRKCMDSRIQETSRKLRSLQAKKTRLYEDLTEGILDEADYFYEKETYGKEYELLSVQFEKLIAGRTEYREMASPENKWIRMIKSIRNSRKLSQELVDTAIERVLVYEGGNIEIVMKYQDVFKLTRDYVMEIQGKRENTDEGTEDSNLYQVVNG